ncbi:MFS transporter [Terrarubrum flagellatum]|uniref:MFS transporter n=1 Tax=Terrirubrum flagellatum TaxID=2895980 RepID=UPI003144E19A
MHDIASSQSAQGVAGRKASWRTIIATSIGAVFEWYDLAIYAMFVTTFSKQFFPTSDPTVSLLLSLGTFASAWLVRPLGAIVIGGYADRAGRKPAMVLSAGLMMLGTGVTALLPTYATIGIAAPVMLIIARMIQGFSAGGEFGSATALLAEQDPKRSGFYASIQWAASGFSVFMASLIAYIVNTSLAPDQVLAWGWRIPFVIGMMIGPVAWYIRRKAEESPEFAAAKEENAQPLREVATHDKSRILLGAGIVAAGAAGSFMNQYMPTFANTSLGLSPSQALIGTLVASSINSIAPMIFGHLSDRLGRIPVMGFFAVIGLLMTYPLFLWLVGAPTLPKLIATQALLAFVLYSGYFATAPSLLSELFQVRRRTTGISIAYVLGQLLFGGVTPLIAGFLVAQTKDPTSPGLYLTGVIILSILSLWGCRRLGVR